MKLDVTKLPLGEVLVASVLAAVVATFVLAYAYASDGDSKTSGFGDFVQPPATFSFTVFEDANETGFAFLGGSTGVQLSIDAAAYAGEVTVEYLVPEPVTMSMIAFGGVALFRRKRKR